MEKSMLDDVIETANNVITFYEDVVANQMRRILELEDEIKQLRKELATAACHLKDALAIKTTGFVC